MEPSIHQQWTRNLGRIGSHEQKQVAARLGLRQVPVHSGRQPIQCVLRRELPVDEDVLGLAAQRRKSRRALRVPVKYAVGEEGVVIDAMPGTGGGQLRRQIGGQTVPLIPGQHHGLTPFGIPFGEMGQPLIPAQHRGIDLVWPHRHPHSVPIGAKRLHPDGGGKVKQNFVPFHENPRRRGIRGGQAAPLIERLLCAWCRRSQPRRVHHDDHADEHQPPKHPTRGRPNRTRPGGALARTAVPASLDPCPSL